MAQVHLDNLPGYATLAQGLYGGKCAVAYFRKAPLDGVLVDLGCAIKGTVTAIDAGSQYIPHDHDSEAKAADYGTMSDGQLVDLLEEELSKADKFGADESKAVPWAILVPILMAIAQKLLERLLKPKPA